MSHAYKGHSLVMGHDSWVMVMGYGLWGRGHGTWFICRQKKYKKVTHGRMDRVTLSLLELLIAAKKGERITENKEPSQKHSVKVCNGHSIYW